MHLGVGLGVTRHHNDLAAAAIALFANGEQGAWYDPSDFSSMYQDSAGTTPVTAVEQPVGKINDKSGRGNHATQATAASRPVLKQDANGRYYLNFDGVDDSLATAAIDFTATDKMTVWAGIYKSSDAVQVLLELSANSDGTVGSCYLANVAAGTIRHQLTGTTQAYRNGSAALATGYVVTQMFDIGGAALADEIQARLNGVAQTLDSPTAAAGTGNFGSHPINIGRRNSATFPYNGRLYSLIVRGAASTAAQIAAAERYCAAKAGVTL